uniref:MAP3K12-binding inhibitory protein 1 n=1 Tax=Ciona savignyi TaxID=51511 RepID=H2YAE7_CIOSA
MAKSNMNCVSESITKFAEQSGLAPEHVTIKFDSLAEESDSFYEALEHLVWSLQDILDRRKPATNHNNENAENLQVDPGYVQITASKEQLDKRIAAFISQAQNLVDEQNVHEFAYQSKLTSVEKEDQYGCARTNAVYRRPANRMHMQVSKVENQEGPQTQIDSQGNWLATNIKPEPQFDYYAPHGVQERLRNLEQHVGIKSSTVPKEVYARLRTLEERVLELEATSPEYFDTHETSSNRSRNPSKDESQFTIDEIDDRIRYLKRKLIKK